MQKIVIGLTGQSGSGKSTVAKMFAADEFVVVDADAISKEITATKETALMLSNFFGDTILTEENFLNRKALAKIVFSDKSKLRQLNQILHPIISERIKESISNCSCQYVLLDAPQLFESGLNNICNKVIAVVAKHELLVERIMKRDNIDQDMAIKRLSSQLPIEFFREHADYIIESNNDFKKLKIDVQNAIRFAKGYHDSFDF